MHREYDYNLPRRSYDHRSDGCLVLYRPANLNSIGLPPTLIVSRGDFALLISGL